MAITGSQVAYAYAQSAVMRSGSSRSNVHSTRVFIAIAGVQVATAPDDDDAYVLGDSLSIREREGETPNTASFEAKGFQPTDGQDVVITMGSINNLDRLFAGTILSDTHGYVGTPANGQDSVNVIDYTWQLTRRTIAQRFTNESATDIALAIIALCPGFTALQVEAGLPTVDEITFTNQTLASALSNLAQRIGGYWKVTYHQDVRFGISADPAQTDPTTLTEASALLTGMEAFTVTRDLSQVITRQPVEGGGGTAVGAVAAGTTEIPISEPSWYNAGGGTVVSGPQRITYTSKTQAAPTTAPTVVAAGGTGIDLGLHAWAYTFVTASGETLPSLLAVLTLTADMVAPTTAPTAVVGPNDPSYAPGIALVAGDTVTYYYSYSGAASSAAFTAETDHSPASTGVVAVTGFGGAPFLRAIDVSGPYATDATVKWVHLWISVNGGTYYWTQSVANQAGGGTWTMPFSHQALTSTYTFPATQPSVRQAALSAIAVGPVGTTQRKIYRTAAGDSQLKLQQTIANNTATTGVTDATADASLGANVPSSDTSALVLSAVSTTNGATAAGATSLVLVSGTAFLSTGGWVLAAGLPVRYTGKSTNTLTGIPATGAGSITAAIPSASTVTSCATLSGIPASGAGSILYAINQGDPVNLRVTVDDATAQAAIAILMLPVVDDGIIEGPVIQDGRISETEATARGEATLALRSALAVSVSYATRDINTHAGRTIGVDLPAPTSLTASLKVQAVTISQFHPALWPTAQVEASSTRFTLEDLLRIARTTP